MRIALGIEYAGDVFCGWQSQPSGCGVQDALERALGQIAGEPITTIAAGRTDAGVHALACPVGGPGTVPGHHHGAFGIAGQRQRDRGEPHQ